MSLSYAHERACLHPAPRGGGKRGVWSLRADGSGTWTREDPSAIRFRDLFMSGPKACEVLHRETFDGDTGELLDITRNWGFCKLKCADLPPPIPRRLRSVFHFAHTDAQVPSDVVAPTACAPAATKLEEATRVASCTVEALYHGCGIVGAFVDVDRRVIRCLRDRVPS